MIDAGHLRMTLVRSDALQCQDLRGGVEHHFWPALMHLPASKDTGIESAIHRSR